MIKNSMIKSDPKRLREAMVRGQLEARGIVDPLVLQAMREIPRHIFLPDDALHARAYGDSPLPIGHGQTISQPYVVACMSQWLNAKPGMSVLEVGTGSGYQAAVLAAMGLDVFTVERVRELYFHASSVFKQLGYRRIRTKLADGTLGWPDAGPFDRIIITAGGPEAPKPLLEQLLPGGVLVMPLGKTHRQQKLVRITKDTNGTDMVEHGPSVAFVDLVGSHGW